MINAVSIERINARLTRTLTESQNPGDALHTLQTIGLLPEILPEVSRLIGVEQPTDYHPEGDVYTHTRMMLNQMEQVSDDCGFTQQEIAYATLLHDIAKPDTYALHPDPKQEANGFAFWNMKPKERFKRWNAILKRIENAD